ncbi:hypothetical protein EYC84_001656 [Monilinia fructicola]|uniref:Uncharacterized protein n=1 Tax=Monilinia fructicola TaxID=38448 RepID=A0A5M9JU98_MONFR|nr:hypothetical protein EYC84_001656 [Monilinia fructicola]
MDCDTISSSQKLHISRVVFSFRIDDERYEVQSIVSHTFSFQASHLVLFGNGQGLQIGTFLSFSFDFCNDGVQASTESHFFRLGVLVFLAKVDVGQST